MTDTKQPRWERFGLPKQVVLYPDPRRDVWRHAVYSDDGVVDGYVRDVPAGAPAAEAQAALTQMLDRLGRDFYQVTFTIEWAPSDKPDWWTGRVTPSSLTP